MNKSFHFLFFISLLSLFYVSQVESRCYSWNKNFSLISFFPVGSSKSDFLATGTFKQVSAGKKLSSFVYDDYSNNALFWIFQSFRPVVNFLTSYIYWQQCWFFLLYFAILYTIFDSRACVCRKSFLTTSCAYAYCLHLPNFLHTLTGNEW